MLPFKYKSKGYSERGIWVELYLPKHASFQGTLYDTLKTGFDFKKVKAHFLDPAKRPKIREFLDQHKYVQWYDYTDKYINKLRNLYWGYSLYEVDGVFKPSRGKKVIEERTQIIRLMFLPLELDKKLKQLKVDEKSAEHRELKDVVGTFLRSAGHTKVLENYEGLEKEVVQYIYDWYMAVGFFLFGYIVFEICSKIETVGDDNIGDYEKEVWLTSMWHFNVNRVEFTGKPKKT